MNESSDKKETKNEDGSQKNEHHKFTVGNRTVDWPSKTITTEQIAEKGNLNVSDGIVSITNGKERDLNPGEEIDLDKENTFGKDHSFKRGSR